MIAHSDVRGDRKRALTIIMMILHFNDNRERHNNHNVVVFNTSLIVLWYINLHENDVVVFFFRAVFIKMTDRMWDDMLLKTLMNALMCTQTV